jgi:SAM-dependent methyltransferase
MQIPLESDSVDLVVCRLLLEYLADRAQAIAEMVHVVKPGGRVVLQDLDGQIVWHWPVDEDLKQQVDRVLEHLRRSGFDPFVGRKLFSLAHAAGLSQLDVRVDPYHLIYGRVEEHTQRLWELKLDILLPVAAEALGCEMAAQRLKKQFLDYLCRDDSLTYSTIFTVTGIKAENARK